MKNLRLYLIDVYLDYFNNYLTVEKFAEHNEVEILTARKILQIGKGLHERNVAFLKAVL